MVAIASHTVTYLFTLTFLLHMRGVADSRRSNCGDGPQIMPGSSTVQWENSNTTNHAYLRVEVRKVNAIWNQTGCLNSEEFSSFYAHPSTSMPTNYTFPSMDFDSLYIAKAFWIDYNYNYYYLGNSECYFIPQRSEYLHIPEALQTNIT